jgi:hypothetical protein
MKSMLARTSRPIVLVVCFALAVPVFAQYGFPLKGSWSGDWGTSVSNRERVLLDFDWVDCPDNCRVVGTLNPGPDSAPLTNIAVSFPETVANADDPWIIHFEANTKDASGATVRVIVDGRMDNLGAFKRRITGAWQQGNRKGEFHVIRN